MICSIEQPHMPLTKFWMNASPKHDPGNTRMDPTKMLSFLDELLLCEPIMEGVKPAYRFTATRTFDTGC